MPIEQQAQAENVRDSIANVISTLETQGSDTPGAVQADQQVPQGADKPGEPGVLEAARESAGRDPATGRFAAKQPADAQVAVPGAEPKPEPQAQQPGQQPNGLTDTPARTARGPASWRPEVREKWASLPVEVQQEVTRREREVMIAMQESAQARQFTDNFMQTIQPYQHIIALEGGDPLKTFGDYMKTATLLRSGAPQEKANAVAQAIMQYGIDINLLDGALSHAVANRPMPQGQQQPQVVDPRVDQILQFINGNRQQQAAQAEAAAEEELIAFVSDPKNEFFEDLRLDIADIMRLSAARGQRVTLAEAYDKAAKLHPEVSKIMAQRAAAAEAERKKQDVLNKRRAAGSITDAAPRQSGSAQAQDTSVRAAIEAAIEQHS